MVAEQIHRYPRWITLALDLLSFLAVGAALLLFSRDLMGLLWKSYGIDTSLMARVPYLPEIVQAITQGAALPRREVVGSAGTFNFVFGLHLLLPALGWLARPLGQLAGWARSWPKLVPFFYFYFYNIINDGPGRFYCWAQFLFSIIIS